MWNLPPSSVSASVVKGQNISFSNFLFFLNLNYYDYLHVNPTGKLKRCRFTLLPEVITPSHELIIN